MINIIYRLIENIKEIIYLDRLRDSYRINAKKEKLIIDKLKKESETISKKINTSKENIYNEFRNKKINDNKLIVLKTCEIDLLIEKKTLFSKILSFLPFNSSIIYDPNFIGLYINNGSAKFINIPKMQNNNLSLLQQELYNIEDYQDALTLNNKRLLFINNKVIFNPKLDLTNKDFLLDIQPEYYWRLNNKTFDFNLTIPKNINPLGGLNLKKVLLIAGVLIVGYLIISGTKIF